MASTTDDVTIGTNTIDTITFIVNIERSVIVIAHDKADDDDKCIIVEEAFEMEYLSRNVFGKAELLLGQELEQIMDHSHKLFMK
jgi:hypothetical protein